jgi:hypothetical protein
LTVIPSSFTTSPSLLECLVQLSVLVLAPFRKVAPGFRVRIHDRRLVFAWWRPPRQIGDLLHEVDLAHHQPRLGVVVLLARRVRHPHIAGHVELRLVLVGDAHVIGGPGNAGGEIADLDGDLARNPALDVPLQGIVAAGREGRIDQVDFVLLVEDAELDRGGIDERVGPRELDAVDALFHGQQPMLADHGDVFRVVDRKLRSLAGGQGHQIDGGPDGCNEGQEQQKRPKYAAKHERIPSAELFSIVLRRRRVCQQALE